jgi:HSP20 family protein
MFNLMLRRNEAKEALARREYTPLDLLRYEFGSLFNRMFSEWPLEAEREYRPWAFEVEEKENEFVIRAEMPGFETNEIEVTLRGNEMTLLAEHKAPLAKEAPPAPAEKEAVERRYMRLERHVALPAGTEPEKAEAAYRNGILEVRVPLVPEAKPRRVEVKV